MTARSIPLFGFIALSGILWLTVFAPTAKAQSYASIDLYTLQVPSQIDPGLGLTIGWTGANFVSPMIPGSTGIVGSGLDDGFRSHALLWGNSNPAIDLHSAPFIDTSAAGIAGGSVVGSGVVNYPPFPQLPIIHAVLWAGGGAPIDLNPVDFDYSYAVGTTGSQHVGYGAGTPTGGRSHALLWSGSTNAAVDLHPSNFYESYAYATDGIQQVGVGNVDGTALNSHALLWNGTNSAIDLNPSGFVLSTAYGVAEGMQVGFGWIDSYVSHALLWNGTNAAIDLNPSGFVESVAIGLKGDWQIGYGHGPTTDGYSHSLLWNGNNNAVDLGSLLPDGFTTSYGFTLDSEGNAFGVAQDTDDNWHVIEWSPTVPEPTILGVLVFAAIALTRRVQPRCVSCRSSKSLGVA